MKSKELTAKLKNIRLLVMDVDGTLTDGAMYYSERGEELKRFSTRDGMGITLLNKAGIASMIVTSEDSLIARRRAEKLSIAHIETGCKNKSEALNRISEKLDLLLENIAYIGDDVNDLHAMQLCGVCACPADAVDSIKKVADYICKDKGGNGAVREFAEIILLSQNKQIILTENW